MVSFVHSVLYILEKRREEREREWKSEGRDSEESVEGYGGEVTIVLMKAISSLALLSVYIYQSKYFKPSIEV